MKERLKSNNFTVLKEIILSTWAKCYYVTVNRNLQKFVTREHYLQGKKREVEIEKRIQVLF
jgi:hypothetical protein